MKTINLKLSELVFDPEIYPRGDIDRHHVDTLRQAWMAGAKFPPFTVDEATKKIVDGAHRREVYRSAENEEMEVACIVKTYANEGEMFLDAMRLNASHGLPLSPFDRARATLKCHKFGLGAVAIAAALGMTMERFRAIGEGRTAKVVQESPAEESAGPARQPVEVALRRSVKHLSGRHITPQQHRASRTLSERTQFQTVSELVTLLENDLLDKGDRNVMDRLRHLWELLSKLFASGPVMEKTPESLAELQGVE